MSAETEGKAITKFLKGPLRTSALMGIGILTIGQILDMGEKSGDKAEANVIRARAEKELKRKDKDDKREQREYDEMMRELYLQGYQRNYANVTPGNYFGYTPGLIDDPNMGLVQRMFDQRIGHTKM